MSKIARIFKPLNSNLLNSYSPFNNRFSLKYFSASNPPYKTTTFYTAYSSSSSGNEDSPVGDDDGTIYNNRRVHKALAISSTKTDNNKIHESYYAESSYSYTNLGSPPVIEQGNSEISAIEIMQLLKCGDTKKLMELNNLGYNINKIFLNSNTTNSPNSEIWQQHIKCCSEFLNTTINYAAIVIDKIKCYEDSKFFEMVVKTFISVISEVVNQQDVDLMKNLIGNKFNLEYYINHIHIPVQNNEFATVSSERLFNDNRAYLNAVYAKYTKEYFKFLSNLLSILNYNQDEITPQEEKILNNHIQYIIHDVAELFMRHCDVYSLNELLENLGSVHNNKSIEIGANILSKLVAYRYEDQFKKYLSEVAKQEEGKVLFTKNRDDNTILETLFLERKWELVDWINKTISYEKSSDYQQKYSLQYICANLDTEFMGQHGMNAVETDIIKDFYTDSLE